MKKIIALVCAMVLLLLPMTVLAEKKDATIMYVDTNNSGMLNVRKSTHTHSDNVVIKLETGTEVKVMEYNSNNTWVKIEVTVNKKVYEGYVMNRYLSATKPVVKPTKPAATATPAAPLNYKNFKHVESTRMTVKPATPGGFVNMRWAPSKSVTVMCKLYADAQVIVIAKDKTWAQVYEPTTGYVGFVMLSFLK